MPFVVITIGVLMIVVGIRNTQCQLGGMLVHDFTGSPNFWYWIAAIFIIGALGYADELRGPSRAMLALVLVALVLANRGFFQSFIQQLKQGSATPPPPGPPSPAISSVLSGGAAGASAGAGAFAGSLPGVGPLISLGKALGL